MAAERACGGCSLCCTVLRVDELRKLGGVPCRELRPGGDGCSIHPTRPGICRAYRCLWLRGSLRDDDRPDRLGAVLDLANDGAGPYLAIRQARPDAYDGSQRLREIAAEWRRQMPVRITDTADVLDPDRPYRVLMPDGDDHLVRGALTEVSRSGRPVAARRLPWPARLLRRATTALQRRRLSRWRP